MRLRTREGRTLHAVANGVETPTQRVREARQPIGVILLEMGAISQADFSRVLAEQERTGGLFGEVAQRMGVVTPALIQRAIERQQHFPVLRAGDGRVDRLVVAAYEPNDPLARGARELRGVVTSARLPDGGAVTSVALLGIDAIPQASLLAANVGVAFAQAGYRTLLADVNLDAPVQDRLFRLSNRVGVSGLLSSDGDERAAVQESPIANLSVLTTGPAVPNVLELYDRGRLFQRLRPLSTAFDMVLVDASAGDAAAIAACEGVDAVLLVLKTKVTRLASVRRMSESLRARGAMILGSVLTGG